MRRNPDKPTPRRSVPASPVVKPPENRQTLEQLKQAAANACNEAWLRLKAKEKTE